jgi:replicative DNA helicase
MKTDTKSVRLPHQDFKQLQTPKALDLEKAVLGAILVDKAGIATLKTVFQRSDVFYHKAHQLIHKA